MGIYCVNDYNVNDYFNVILHIFHLKSLCNLTIDFYLKMCYNVYSKGKEGTKKMTNTELNELLNTLRTPIDFTPLRAKADAIKADLDRIGKALDDIEG